MNVTSITTAKTIAFAYTVKSLGKDTDADYSAFFKKLLKYNITIEYKISERDSHNKLHYHGIILLPKGFYRRRLTTNGISMKLEEIYNKAGWEKYIHKDCEFKNMPREPDDIPTWRADANLFC